MWKSSSDSSEILNKARELLSKYPLCDSCLGRCFARLGQNLTNAQRGFALKVSLLLQVDQEVKEHKVENLELVKELFFNIGTIAQGTFKNYFSEEFQKRSCYLCGDVIEELLDDFERKAIEVLKDRPKYVLGVRLSDDLRRRETAFSVDNGLIYYESLKNELKREVGKRLSAKGFPPEMDNPEVEVIYDVGTRSVYTLSKVRKSLYVYNRLSRGVPISSWYGKGTSLEDELKKAMVVPFSEPSEVRVLDPYPLVVKEETREEIRAVGYYIKKVGEVSGRELGLIAQSLPQKRVYRVTVYTEEEVGQEVYDGIRDLIIEARNFDELKEKLKEVKGEVLTVDLIDSEGKHKRILEQIKL
ncbi:MAG: pseudouridylate synthase [Candidatus Aramenus sp.]|jgi:tRNA pseudouridine(54/55) synthase|nr:pseudouridylate synthase [Candidatus Aramenus sp.]